MNKILYRPRLRLHKKYDTDGVVAPVVEYQEQVYEEDIKIEQLVEIANQILSLQEVCTQLPEAVKPTVNTIINTLQFIFVQIDPDYIPGESGSNEGSVNDNANIVVTPVEEDPTKNNNGNNLLFSDAIPNVIIKTIPVDKAKVINQRYCGTLLEIVKDYIVKLKKTTSNYFVEMGMLMLEHDKAGIDFLEKKYTYKTTDLTNKNLQHVSDFVIKSQIVRDQKQRLMNKIINEEEVLNKVKACEVARELFLRYQKETFKPNSVYNDLFSNMTLKESQLQYEQKLDNNLFELYKYMNSSVILLDECLRLYMREAQAKSILIKEEGIKL